MLLVQHWYGFTSMLPPNTKSVLLVNVLSTPSVVVLRQVTNELLSLHRPLGKFGKDFVLSES